MVEGVAEDEADEFLIRFNLNGVELNEEGFQKLQEEIALTPLEADCVMPWGKERVTFYLWRNAGGRGLEPVLIRRGLSARCCPAAKSARPGPVRIMKFASTPRYWNSSEYLAAAAHAYVGA